MPLKEFGLLKILTILFLSLISLNLFAALDPHSVLGLSPGASKQEIKSAYRKLVLKYHPDHNGGSRQFEPQLQEVNDAYQQLTDPNRRQRLRQGSNSRGNPFYPSPSTHSSEADANSENDQRVRRAEEYARKYSNQLWSYDPQSRSFFDKRTQIKSYLTLRHGTVFLTDEAWHFRPETGIYENYFVDAKWNPSDDLGWHRYTSNFNSRVIQIDIQNGFALSAQFQPGALNTETQLFNDILNPVLYIKARTKRIDREAKMIRFLGLDWTPELKALYLSRVREHIRVLNHKDMQPFFTTQVPYNDAFVKTLIENPKTLENPVLVVELIHSLKWSHKALAEALLEDKALHHPNAQHWFKALTMNEPAMTAFFERAFQIQDASLNLVKKRFSKVFPGLLEAGLTSSSLLVFISELAHRYGREGFEAFKETLQILLESNGFIHLVANLETDDPRLKYVTQVLNWFESIDPISALVYLRALQLPGVTRQHFHYQSRDRSQWLFDENGFNRSRQKTADERKGFIFANLPSRQVSDPAPSCPGVFSGPR